MLPVDSLSIISNNRVGFVTSGQFTVRIVATEPRFVTSLSVIAYRELNGSTITCTAASASVPDQSTIAIVVGKLNYAPKLCMALLAIASFHISYKTIFSLYDLGALDPVSNLNVTFKGSFYTISWDAVTSLDPSTINSNITYCVSITDSSSAEIVSQCSSNTTYNFNQNECDGCNVTVTPVHGFCDRNGLSTTIRFPSGR